MDKALKVYPIPTGNKLNIFSTEDIVEVRIMNLSGNIVYCSAGTHTKTDTIDIQELPMDTYIVEVLYDENKHSRSMFVKL